MSKREDNRECIYYWFLRPRWRHYKAHISWKFLNENEKFWSITYNFRVSLSHFRQSCKVWSSYTQLMVPTYIKFVELHRFHKNLFSWSVQTLAQIIRILTSLKKSHQCILSWANLHSPCLSISVVNGFFGCSFPKILDWSMHAGKNHSDKGYKYLKFY